MVEKKFRILSLDGGGIRGLYSAKILKRIEEECGVDFYNDFDLIVGTSTGSILAGAIVRKIPLTEVISLYENEGKNIFKKKSKFFGLFKSRGLNDSIYDSSYLEKKLKEIFGNTVLGDIKKPLLINATDIGNSEPFVFKTVNPKKKLVRDPKIALYDAVLASSSAPIYFSPHKINDYLLADGGLWANSPVLVALSEAVHTFDAKPNEVVILSIGTGNEKNNYNINTEKWGFLTGWRNKKMISTILSLQTTINQNLLKFLIPRENILNLSYTSDKVLPLDDTSQNKNLLSKAERDFSDKHKEIQDFINRYVKDIDVS